MYNFNWGGRGLPFRKGDRVNLLSRSKFGAGFHCQSLSDQSKEQDRLLLPLGRYRSSGRSNRFAINDVSRIIMIFCVLFSTLAAYPAFGQDAVREVLLKDNEGHVIQKVVYNFNLYEYVNMKPSFIKTVYDRHPGADYKKFPLGTFEISKSKLPKIKVGEKVPDEIMDLPLWVVNNENGSDTLTLRQVPPKQWIILDVWDEYCTPCIKSMNHWEQFLKTESYRINFFGVYASYYAHRAPTVARNRGYLSTQVIGASAEILTLSFLGDGHCLGPNIWIKDGVLFGISHANRLSDAESLAILSGKLTEIPAHARFNQYWNKP